VAPPKSDFEKQMMLLEAEIRRLEAEFNMFFAGNLPRPPWETRARVAALVKKHDQSFIRNTADRFRFDSLQNRHAKFIELWERQMTNRELGRPMRGGVRVPDAPKPAASASPRTDSGEPRRDHAEAASGREGGRAEAGVVKFGRSDDTSAEAARVKELYEKLAEAKKQVGEEPVAFERVAALVKAQVDKFADDGSKVSFRIAMKDGKVSLTVKPEKDD